MSGYDHHGGDHGGHSSRPKETILRVRKLPGGTLEFEDWRGKRTQCAPGDLGTQVSQLLDDPALPRVDVVSPGFEQFVHQYATRFMPPELRPLVGPGVTMVQQAWAYFQHIQREHAQRRYYEAGQRARQQQQQQERQQSPQGRTSRPVRRRGQKVG